MNTNFADRLTTAIEQKRVPACVGLDPLIERLPTAILAEHGIEAATPSARDEKDLQAHADALESYGTGVIEVVAEFVPAVKINIAFFERYYDPGIRTYHRLVQAAREAGLIVVGDVKRADIGHSTTQYAVAQLGGLDAARPAPDSVTVNPYFGYDAIRPFVDIARERGRGIFVLVQTSNASAAEVQGLVLSDQRLLCQHVAMLVQGWASDPALLGAGRYSCIGAVVSPRDVASTRLIRELMPNCIFLVPGFGAQGRTTDEVAECFKKDGTGAIVTASRSVIYAYQTDRFSDTEKLDWKRCVATNCKTLVDAIRSVVAR